VRVPEDIHIGIIGGLGKMGRWFDRFFREQGYAVSIADRETPGSPEDLAPACQVVLVAVPLQDTIEVVRHLGPLIREEALLMDIASLKSEVMTAMLEATPAAVIGTHPLFGPGEPNITGQTVVLCPGRGREWQEWLTSTLVRSGAQVEVTSPEVHDYYMALVQGLTHFCTLALGLTVDSLDLGPAELRHFATPTFHRKLMEISYLVSQNSDLYAAMSMLNTAFGDVLREFEKVFFLLRQVIEGKDAGEFTRLFEQVRSRFSRPSP
jgi:prephenate dehydrogenase